MMSSHAALVTGTMAQCLLRATRFRVEACFARSLYLRPEGMEAAAAQALPAPSLLCCGQADLAPGPLMVLCATWPAEGNAPPQGSRVERRGRALLWPGGSVVLEGARPWAMACGRRGAGLWDAPGDMPARMAAFWEHAPALPQGLAALWGQPAPREDALLRRAERGLKALYIWLRQGEAERAPAEVAVEALLGLGPGLTPSGDDALAGCLLALHALGRARHGAMLAQCVAQRLGATNSISAAHLAASMQGLGAAPLHALLHAVLHLPLTALWQRSAGLARQLGRMGHSSGWDAATGLLVSLAACVTPWEWGAWRCPVEVSLTP